MRKTLLAATAATSVALLSACGSMSSGPMMAKPYSQDALPDAVKVPAGHRVALETVGVGEITYECRAKTDSAGAYEWFFVGPKADLNSRAGSKIGSYYGPPATWESNDGSKIGGAQVAVAPSPAGNIAHQLVKANPAMGSGAMTGITYVQRVATRGGVAPSKACDGGGLGKREIVKYQADYIFYRAM